MKPHLSPEQIRERLYRSSSVRHASYWQIILSVSLNPGKPASEYCAYLGISDTKFYRIVSLYNDRGAEFCEGLSQGGRREGRCVMSLEEEVVFLQGVEARALRGEVLVARQLRGEVEQKVGHRVSNDYLWDLLRRHGWSTKAPRPEHPKADPQTQESFKKKHPSSSGQKVQRP